MGDLDDDFGDIYADVEAQASSAINGFTQSHTQPLQQDRHETQVGFVSDCKKPSSVSEELGEKVSIPEANEEECTDSDSDDDLNIVLNDGGNSIVPLGGSVKVDDYEDEDDDGPAALKDNKYVWTQGSNCQSNGKANESVDMVPSVLVGEDNDSNVYNQRKGSSSQSLVARNRFGFRLPWYRTILDVDIESFEDTPWRYPGVDITDYFNFDLNEDSWKDYCNSLEQLRQLKSTKYGMPVSSKFYQAREAGSEYGKFAQETMSKEMNHDGSWVSYCRPKGQAIQIEDSIFERQPSFDGIHPPSWDSDVVIQISVLDPTEETSNSGEEQGHTNGTAHETSENGEFDANGNQNIISSDTNKENASSLGTEEENRRILDRCPEQISASHPMMIDSDNHKNKQVVDVDANNQKEINVVSSENVEVGNKTKESLDSNTSYADQCMMENLLSLSDDDQLSLLSSCFASDSDTSKNSVHLDPEDTQAPVRSSDALTEPCKSVTSSFKNSRSNCIKRKLVDSKDYSTCTNPAEKKRNVQDRRLNNVGEPKNHINHNNVGSPTSDTEDLYDRNYGDNFRRRKERLRDFGCSNREDIFDYKESNFSSHYGTRYADNHVQTDNKNFLRRKSNNKFPEKLDPYSRRTFNGRESFCEDMDANGSHFGRTQFIDKKSSLARREFRGLHSKYSSYTFEESDAKWKRKRNQLPYKKIPNYNDGCFDYNCENDFGRDKSGRRASFTDQRRNNMDEFDERQFSHVSRELRNSRRRSGYVDSPYGSRSGKTEDECKHRENQYLSLHSHRELYADEGSWNDSISPRETDESYWRHVRNIDVADTEESNWFHGHNDAYEMEDNIYPNDQLRWRRPNWRSEVMHWTEDHLAVRHNSEQLFTAKASCSYRKYARREKVHAKYVSPHDGMHIDNVQPEPHRLIMTRKGYSANCTDRRSNIYRGKHDQTVLRCKDLIDLAVGEQKVKLGEPKNSGRRAKSRSLMCNGRLENMDPGVGRERIASVNSHSSESEEAAVKNSKKVGCDRNIEKEHHIFPDTAQNADLDIEEGQIVTQELNTTPLLRKHASESAITAHSVKKRIFGDHNASNENKVVEPYDKQRILETMAKMEKRGERFKEPITLKKEPNKSSMPEADPTIETADEKQHRPSRKRQWGGRFSKNDSLKLGISMKIRF